MKRIIGFLVLTTQLLAQGQWSAPITLSVIDGRDSQNARVTVNGCRIGITAWLEDDLMAVRQVQTSVFNGKNWSFPPVNVSDQGNILFPFPSLSPCRNIATMTWRENVDTMNVILASRFNGSTWTDPLILSDSSFNSTFSRVRTDPCGNAVAVWRGDKLTGEVIQATRFQGGFWAIAEDISNSDANHPQLGIDFNGNAIAIWEINEGGGLMIQAARFNGSSWSAPQTISNPSLESRDSQISMNPKGKAVAIWREVDGDSFATAAIFNGSSWQPSQRLSASGADALAPVVSINPCGNAFAIWNRSNVIQAALLKGMTWSSPQNLSGGGVTIGGFDVDSDYLGNAFAVWEDITSGNIFVNRFNGTSWSSPFNLTNGVNVNANPRIAAFPGGNAAASWQSNDMVEQVIQVSNFTTPLSSLSVKGCSFPNQFLGQSETVKCLSWEPSAACSLTGYEIIRNGKKIATVSSCCCSYQDHNRGNCCDNYVVRAISSCCVPVESASIRL